MGAFIVVLTMVIGCSGSHTVLLPEYKGIRIKAHSLVIQTELPEIYNPVDVADGLGQGAATEVFLSYFKEQFSSHFSLAGPKTEVKICSQCGSPYFLMQILNINSEETMRVKMPPEGFQVIFDSLQPEYAIFISDFVVSRESLTKKFWTGASPGGSMIFSGTISAKLKGSLQFIVWDNIHGRLVSYGRIRTEQVTPPKVGKLDWNRYLNDLADKILDATPFISNE
jgi:hypothetical protein